MQLNPEYIRKPPGWATSITVPPFINSKGRSTQSKCEKGSIGALTKMTCATFNPIEYLVDNLLNKPDEDTASKKKLYELIYTCQQVFKDRLGNFKMEGQSIGEQCPTNLRNLMAVCLSSPFGDTLGSYVSQSYSSGELIPSSLEINLSTGRYQKEFNEVELIGKGGFGRVYLAKNKVDNCSYAVKKISLRYCNCKEFRSSLKEARTLAKLDHPNIVSYKCAWLETSSISSREESLASSSISPYGSSLSLGRNSERVKTKDGTSDQMYSVESSSTSKSNLFESVRNDLENTACDVPSKESSVESSDISFREDIPSDQKSSKGCLKQESKLDNRYENATLYIQMQFCTGNLRDWLDKRNEELNNSKILDAIALSEALYIFQKILNGMEYVNKKEIIHHDLKPGNIFIDGIQYCPSDSKNKRKVDGEVRIGDFGLACHCAHLSNATEDDCKAIAVNQANLSDNSSCIIEKGINSSMSENEKPGTVFYSAPEQLKGCCNHKSDMYSLGIILLELLHPFATTMERSKTLAAFKSEGMFPEFFEQRYPAMASLIKKLTSNDVDDRPCITDVVKIFSKIVEYFENDMSEGFNGCLRGNNAVQNEIIAEDFKAYTLSRTTITSSGCSSHACETVKKDQQLILAELEKKIAGRDKKIEMLTYQMNELRNYCLTLQSNTKNAKWNLTRKFKKDKEKKEEMIKELQERNENLENEIKKNRHIWKISKELKKENLEKQNTIIMQSFQINQLKSLCREKDRDILRMENGNAHKVDSLKMDRHEMKPRKFGYRNIERNPKRKTYSNFKKGAPKVHCFQSDNRISVPLPGSQSENRISVQLPGFQSDNGISVQLSDLIHLAL